jgi:TolB-like protein
MGVVYRAHDEQLERDVAVKVLAPGALSDDNARRRFRKEALSLARLNHPNIAIIFEFGTENGTDFLVTELIPGITLDAKLATGPLSAKDVNALGIQLTQGLAAAHEQGVVHRDLKPGNLRLTPDGRLKILDFGLAQLAPQGDLSATVTLTQPHATTAGTLPYMSPEHLRGQKPDARSDIWAAGVVLYEMATGRRPFSETTGPVLIDAILNHEPRPPGELNRQISPGLENVILKALDKDPNHRYQTAHDMQVDLERQSAGILPLARPRQSSRRPWIVAAAVAIILAAAAGSLIYRRRAQGPPSASSTVVETNPAATGAFKPRRSVAVLGFKSLAPQPDQAWLSTALAEMLTTELGAGEQLRTVPGEAVSRVKSDLALPDTDSLGGDTLSRVRKILGNDLVVLGSYLDLRGTVRVDVRVQDAVSGETLATLSDTGKEDQIFGLVTRLGAQLRDKCGAGPISSADVAAAGAAHPTNQKAAALYADGLARLRAFDALAARELLVRAIVEEPDFAPAHVALSSAWQALGYSARAKDEIQKAAQLAGNLPRQDRLEIQARSYELNGEHDKAVDTYAALFSFFPDSLDYGLGLANAQMDAGKPQDALATLAALRKLSAPVSADPRIDLAESQAADLMGDAKGGLAAAARASERALLIGDRLTAADALALQMSFYDKQGDHARALALGDQARHLYEAAGSKDGAARLQIQTGVLLMNTGERPAAEVQFHSALLTLQQTGDEAFAARALQMIARLTQEEGHLKEAEPLNEQVVATYRRIDAKSKLANALWHRGALMKQLGNYRQADASLKESLELANTAGPKSLTATILLELADLSIIRGDLKDAEAKYETSLASAEQNFKGQVPSIQMAQSELMLQENDLAGARRLQEALLKLSLDARQEEDAAYCRFLLAEVNLEEERFGEAEALARQAAAGLAGPGSLDEEPYALGILIRSLLAQNKVAEAQQALAKAEALSEKSQDVHIQMNVATNVGRVEGALGKPTQAVASVTAVLARATELGCAPCQFEARLALGEIEMKSGKTSAGRTHLEALEKDASARGFTLIALKAQKAAAWPQPAR